MKFGVNVTGLRELGEALSRVEEEIKTKILRDAGKKAMEPVLQDMKQHAGFDETAQSEHMRDSIKIRSTKSKKLNDSVLITVGPSKKHFMKALAQEMGTVKQVSRPFIRPALDYNKQAVLNILVMEIRDALYRIR
ncbi:MULTISPECIES: HK97-gp10 family putative phage morphogenesis protein [Providencia]|uniref:HK97-gp10 family putative phage morphogenesis protein n=1 Tax=Providencia TaxID=586 RepID=UPI001DECB344|nr:MULTISPECIES: HK97-gp10 family putative phage morphogenesis protein [Providencia]ELR5055183.1 HK97 gp10 family phage protein [Providencia rettgeri]ELR5157752.1 HK97 gp10 family phage protein [Providencia rettgeri]ELR5184575.1 HK97 gp10 family phage protein [Providencia rettgeri]ELR5276863.1 HK97 gp10 family phage protein [Providencia rettgeri]MCL0007752.1 HK97 gp10 family phage protein [Providencia rettgeri]